MKKARDNALKHVTDEVRTFPHLTASYVLEKHRLEHILEEIPKALLERPVLSANQFAERTKMTLAEVLLTDWEQVMHAVKENVYLTNEVERLTTLLYAQQENIASILQNAVDQVSRQLRGTKVEDTADEIKPYPR